MATVFTKIMSGEFPGHFVYQDSECAAFLTIEPRAMGHTLVVPRAEVATFTDLEPAVWQHLCAVAQRIGQAAQAEWNTPKVGLLVEGFEVPHVHIHVWPAVDSLSFDPHNIMRNVPCEQLAAAAAKLKARLA